ncbi:MAG TPA: FAD-linked oxidase C-terminal domain-containing protein [Anaerolineae bacterium]
MTSLVHNTDTKSLSDALARSISGEVRFDDATRVLYSTDASNYQVFPHGVVLPKTNDDVAVTMQLCAEFGVPVIARGGGSGLCGQAIGPGLVLDMSKYMSNVLDVNAAAREVRVQPGAVLSLLNKQLAPLKLQFGPDPASGERATIGGIIGTNATGAHSIRHGMTSDHVKSMRCLLADGSKVEFSPSSVQAALAMPGRLGLINQGVAQAVGAGETAIRRDFPRVWRRASGYNVDYITEMLTYDAAHPQADLLGASLNRQTLNLESHLKMVSQFNLAPLIVGAEGSLAIVLDATLNLMPKPARTGLVVLSFETLDAAMRATPALLSADPSSVELMGELIIRLARGLPEYARRMTWLSGTPDAVLIVEFDGESEGEVVAGMERLKRVVTNEHIPCTSTTMLDAAGQADVWAVRKIGLGILLSIRSEYKPISVIEDVAVPVEQLAEYVREMRKVFARHKTDGAFYAHASAGVLHVRPLVNLKSVEGVEAMHDIGRAALALCHQMGGAMSGEHGDGYERTRWNEALYGSEVYRVFSQLKALFDPTNLLNPNKKVNGKDLDAVGAANAMRIGPNFKTIPFTSVFAYRQDKSYAGLVEQCNGNGMCRKQDGGVMCPSYRATNEEKHSTRGRANLLRHFITEQSALLAPERIANTGEAGNPPPVTADMVYDALSLCLSCKACESECPSSVDMAKLKSDFMAKYYAQKGLPLRAFLFGNIARFDALGAPFARLANWALKLPLARLVFGSMGVTDKRPMPAFAPKTFNAWWKKHNHLAANSDATSTVALFIDTFTQYNNPEIGVAAVELLEHAGYTVIIPKTKCCGRTLVSQGQPGAVLPLARHNIKTLAPLARQGIPILGLEPSCIAMLKDDYLDLLPGEDAEAVGKATQSVEDFLVNALADGTHGAVIKPRFAANADILFHGHCHQKALWGTAGTRKVMSLAGYRVKEVDSSCCGMAGAFGYESEHYEISRQVGELSLLPAVRAASAETIIVAPGTSCREQIEQLGGRKPLHPVQVLDAVLNGHGVSF